ncbi:hypothetical protein [Chamaesiphon sp.]|uniref:hypothetical protein n=1 Tax=Chamaesiphon sp. TaxID=2814140 RepID=UPI0035946246
MTDRATRSQYLSDFLDVRTYRSIDGFTAAPKWLRWISIAITIHFFDVYGISDG